MPTHSSGSVSLVGSSSRIGCTQSGWGHPTFSRRVALQAGAVSLLGLGQEHWQGLRAADSAPKKHSAKAVIYIFLSGGLGQQDSFDPKPDAPDNIRGEFQSIATQTAGVRICEHLPRLAERSNRWAMVRSLTHRTNNHSDGHLLMLTGRNEIPPGFSPNQPKDTDWPSMAAVVGGVLKARHNLPPAVVLPERLIHNSGRVIPGQFAGLMGRARDPWFLEASRFEPKAYGAYPEYEFDHQQREFKPLRHEFQIPDLSLPQDVSSSRLQDRLEIMKHVDQQRENLERFGTGGGLSRYRQAALSLLMDANVRKAFDLKQTPLKEQERYGRNAFGWSLLMAARLVEAGVHLVQVNLGNNETWDTHGNAFPHLKDKLFPPTDRAVAALLDDLEDRGLLDSTLVVMAGEFGRTPRVFGLPQHYKKPGRDHWGAAQTVFLAGGGVRGGTVIGSTDKNGGYPTSDPQTPENLAATIYESLGIPSEAMWHDAESRPHAVYHGTPIRGLKV